MKPRLALFPSVALLTLALPLACAAATPVYRTFGDWVVACDGGLVEVAGLPLPIGSLGAVETMDGSGCLAEVIGFRAGHSLMMLLGDAMLLRPQARVRALGQPGEVRVGDALLGRAVDALGDPIDGGPRLDLPQVWPLAGKREGALERASVEVPFDCGVRAINALTTVGVGQRVGIMAGSGVGKSVLIDMIAEAGEAVVEREFVEGFQRPSPGASVGGSGSTVLFGASTGTILYSWPCMFFRYTSIWRNEMLMCWRLNSLLM